MRIRTIVVDGQAFECPTALARLNFKPTVKKGQTEPTPVPGGWQVKVTKSAYFSDLKHGGAAPAFAAALKEHTRQVRERGPVKTGPGPKLRTKPQANKRRPELPPGISGPVRINPPPGKGPAYAEFKVMIPQSKGPHRTASVYIANENTWNDARVEAALDKAIRLRQRAVARLWGVRV